MAPRAWNIWTQSLRAVLRLQLTEKKSNWRCLPTTRKILARYRFNVSFMLMEHELKFFDFFFFLHVPRFLLSIRLVTSWSPYLSFKLPCIIFLFVVCIILSRHPLSSFCLFWVLYLSVFTLFSTQFLPTCHYIFLYNTLFILFYLFVYANIFISPYFFSVVFFSPFLASLCSFLFPSVFAFLMYLLWIGPGFWTECTSTCSYWQQYILTLLLSLE